jgi:holo-[acyl-carrier protein] synthase
VIKGIGVDIIEQARIAQWITRYDSQTLCLVFTEREMKYCRESTSAEQCFATCFAGKEAVGKALGTGLAGIGWNEIEIDPSNRQLTVTLHGAAKRIAEAHGITRWSGSVACHASFVIVLMIAEAEWMAEAKA